MVQESGPRNDPLQDMWREMQSRLFDAIKNENYDWDGPSFRIGADVYNDVDRFNAEKRYIFTEQPLLAALSCEIPNSGDKITFDAAGPPILIVRDRRGGVKAYMNMCPHRGARLINKCTSSQLITCPFHGWTFDLDGKLRSRRLLQAFDSAGESHPDLIRVPVGEWEGLIFIEARPGNHDIDVASFLGSFSSVIKLFDIKNMNQVKSDELYVKSNWKFVLDTFCESYHVSTLHKDTLSRKLYSNLSIKDHFGLHHRYASPGKEFALMTEGRELLWPESVYTAVHYIFPNTTFSYSATVDGKNPALSMYRIFPGKHIGKTIALASTYKPSYISDDLNDNYVNIHNYIMDIVKTEDFFISEMSWPGMSYAPAGLAFITRPQESIIYRYHRDIAKTIGMPLR